MRECVGPNFIHDETHQADDLAGPDRLHHEVGPIDQGFKACVQLCRDPAFTDNNLPQYERFLDPTLQVAVE